MGKYFGTDGFRGEANVNLTAEHAYQIGRFLGRKRGSVPSGICLQWNDKKKQTCQDSRQTGFEVFHDTLRSADGLKKRQRIKKLLSGIENRLTEKALSAYLLYYRFEKKPTQSFKKISMTGTRVWGFTLGT